MLRFIKWEQDAEKMEKEQVMLRVIPKGPPNKTYEMAMAKNECMIETIVGHDNNIYMSLTPTG